MNKPLIGVVVGSAVLAAGALVLLSPSPRAVKPPENLGTGTFVGEDAVPTGRAALEADPRLATLSIPEFSMVNRDGQQADQSIFDDGYSVIAFIFTNCPFACPMIVSALQTTEAAIERSDARFVLFAVDPERDTPERLRAWGEDRGLDRGRWTLLTGDFEQSRRIVEDGLRLTLAPDDSLSIPMPDGSLIANVLHPSRLVLVGPGREVLGFYDSTSPADAERLAARLDAIHDATRTEGE